MKQYQDILAIWYYMLKALIFEVSFFVKKEKLTTVRGVSETFQHKTEPSFLRPLEEMPEIWKENYLSPSVIQLLPCPWHKTLYTVGNVGLGLLGGLEGTFQLLNGTML